MPPVFGPLSPSKARLWSIDETMGTIVRPSVKARTETSGPKSRSSISTRSPLAPKMRSLMMAATAATAWSASSATTTPLPRARPSAFTTTGPPTDAYASARSASSKTSYRAVGIPYRRIKSLA